MKSIRPAKALLIVAVVGLGLSGGLAAAALVPSATPAALAQVWDDTVGKAFEHGPGAKSSSFAAAASYIGISEAQLRTELGTDKSLADVAVAHGKSRDGLIQALMAAEQQNIAALVDQKGIGAKPPAHRRGPGRAGVMGDPLAAAASYLGTTTADLEDKLRSGQTLAQVANATPGKSRDGLLGALVNDATAKIDAAEKAGTITADQATELKANLSERLARFVDASRPGLHRGFPFFPWR